MTQKSLAMLVKAKVAAVVGRLPKGWLVKEIKAAKSDPNRDAHMLEIIFAALEPEAAKRRKPVRSAKRK